MMRDGKPRRHASSIREADRWTGPSGLPGPSKSSSSTMRAATSIPSAPAGARLSWSSISAMPSPAAHRSFRAATFCRDGGPRRLLAAARDNGVPIFYTTIAYANPERDAGLWGKKVPWLNRCKIGSEAVTIDTVLDPRADEPVIVKKFPSAFFETDLEHRLRNLGSIQW